MTSTIRFVPRPRTEEMQRNYPIIRCDRASKFKLAFYCLSNDVAGLEIHYAGKSVPCTSHLGDCKWCALGRQTRWVGYVPATDHARQRLFLAELTPGVMPVVETFLERFQTLRASYFTLSRPSMRDTGRIDLSIMPPTSGAAPGELPAPFDVSGILAKIFGVAKQPDAVAPKMAKVHEPGAAVEREPTMDEIVCRRTESFGALSAALPQNGHAGNGRPAG